MAIDEDKIDAPVENWFKGLQVQSLGLQCDDRKEEED